MFKPATILISALVLQTDVFSQIYVKNTGNIGIGISTPSTKLHVNGDVTAGSANGGYHLIVNDIPTARWALGTGDYGFHIGNCYSDGITWGDKLVINKDGNVGIGVSQPQARLELPNSGNTSFRVGVTSNMANTHTQLINSMAVLADNSSTTSSCGAVAWDYFNNGNNPSWAGTLLLHMGTSVGGNQYGVQAANQGTLLFQNLNAGVIASNGATIYISPLNNISTTFHVNGNVGIGNTNPTYKLHVGGEVRAVRYWADATGGHWPDYVFDSTYKLPSLTEVSTYLKQNHHLPEVPSAEEVKKDGISLSDNQAILLKKVEELTLYAIDQHEKLQSLEQKMNALLEENKKQKEEIESNKKRKTRR
jgi:hypothetical protein